MYACAIIKKAVLETVYLLKKITYGACTKLKKKKKKLKKKTHSICPVKLFL